MTWLLLIRPTADREDRLRVSSHRSSLAIALFQRERGLDSWAREESALTSTTCCGPVDSLRQTTVHGAVFCFQQNCAPTTKRLRKTLHVGRRTRDAPQLPNIFSARCLLRRCAL